tara:strand:+ start:2484 stop:2729 length:246 start_codon:yes stop_codon:yes gene_type:complete
MRTLKSNDKNYPIIVRIEKWKEMDYIISSRIQRIESEVEFEEMRKGLKINEFWQEMKSDKTFDEPTEDNGGKVWKTNFQLS